jgi:hypothetical protein
MLLYGCVDCIHSDWIRPRGFNAGALLAADDWIHLTELYVGTCGCPVPTPLPSRRFARLRKLVLPAVCPKRCSLTSSTSQPALNDSSFGSRPQSARRRFHQDTAQREAAHYLSELPPIEEAIRLLPHHCKPRFGVGPYPPHCLRDGAADYS